MSGIEATLLWIYAAIVAIWPIRLLVLTLILRRQRFLDERSPGFREPEPPLVSAILPAKDEEAYLPDCLASIRAQSYPNLEILVADDRSEDRTGEIARQHAVLDPRIRVVTIEDLPSGWTGKTHALHRAVAEASGEWLWFLDADTLHSPGSLSIIMEYARREGADLASLLPELRCETFWERVVQPLGGIVLMQSFPLHVVHRDQSPLAFANGQYILIRRTAYDDAGGHEAVKDRFVEDIALAGRVKERGYRIRVALVRGIVTCRMYASLKQLIRGWSRILYDALDRRAGRLALRLLDVLVFCQTGHVALAASLVLLASGFERVFALRLLLLSLFHHAVMYAVFRVIYRTSVPRSRHTAWFPLGNVIVDLILMRAIRMCLTGRVSWRDTQYGSANDAVADAENSTPVQGSSERL
jgi:glycosyltransferase involved in cell wall biosynthesis